MNMDYAREPQTARTLRPGRSAAMRAPVALLAAVAFATGTPAAKDEPENQFPELKMYGNEALPWRTAAEDWEGARRRVVSDPGWAEWLKAERGEVDAWIARHRDRVSWVAGWSNDFVSPRDGSRLTWTEAIPGEEVDYFSSPSAPRVEITPKLMAAWVRLWRENHVQMMERSARLHRLTGEPRYAEWAAAQLDFYAEHYLEWEPQRQGARLFWQSLTEGVNLITYAQTVRLLGDAVAPARRALWLEKFFRPEVAVLNENFPRILNITCWLRAASAQVGLIFGDEEMWRKAVDGPFGVRQQVAEGITDDYLWFEQSLGYNSYVVDALASLFVTAGIYGRAEELAHEMAKVQNLMLSTTYMRFPTGQLPNPSDTKGLLSAPDRDLFARLYRVFPTTLGLAEAAGRRNWDTLLDPLPPPPREEDKLPPVVSRNFESSRMAILREGDWQVFLHYGQPPVKSHLQAEVLNFSCFYGNTDVTHDPGTVGYGSDLHKEYYRMGLNHNVLFVNGEAQEQPPKGRKPDPFAQTRAGKLVEFSASPARIAVEHPVYRSDARARRTLEIREGKLTDTASIETTTGKPQKLGLSLHVQGQVQLPDPFRPATRFSEGRPPSFGYWTDVRYADFNDRATFDVQYDRLDMRLSFAVPGPFRVWHGSTPDVPPGRREGFYLETTNTSATFVTTFEPVGLGPRR